MKYHKNSGPGLFSVLVAKFSGFLNGSGFSAERSDSRLVASCSLSGFAIKLAASSVKDELANILLRFGIMLPNLV